MTRKKKHYDKEKCMMSSFIICAPHPVSLRWSNQGGWKGQDM